MSVDLQTLGGNILALNSQNQKHFSTGSRLILSPSSLAKAQQSLLSSNTQCSGQKSFQIYLSFLKTGEAKLILISDNNLQSPRFSQFEDPSPPKTPPSTPTLLFWASASGALPLGLEGWGGGRAGRSEALTC